MLSAVEPKWRVAIYLLFLLVSAPTATLAAPTERASCRPSQTDLSSKPIPDSLGAAAKKALHLGAEAPTDDIYYRCANGRLLVCAVGANLPCGRANKSRILPGVGRFCRRHPGAPFIPLAVSGHDSIYSWRCVGARARPGSPVAQLDREGFFTRYWKPIAPTRR